MVLAEGLRHKERKLLTLQEPVEPLVRLQKRQGRGVKGGELIPFKTDLGQPQVVDVSVSGSERDLRPFTEAGVSPSPKNVRARGGLRRLRDMSAQSSDDGVPTQEALDDLLNRVRRVKPDKELGNKLKRK